MEHKKVKEIMISWIVRVLYIRGYVYSMGGHVYFIVKMYSMEGLVYSLEGEGYTLGG